ncbi:uncharacterized mitochondrial protein AtMg00310-like [Arachis stenosperma]|uniref:uncharacterized mitochondrial protein AtMg00310-like n=1 Tax=Arachis stenosperma TaxID=217475 RepID=UPI0025ACEB36|nr:uncharacterized mitochondrial protein AtMg00310-like [Arachis stenosperma]
MGIKAVEGHLKYLGLPTFVGRSKKQVFGFVQDRVWKKLKGWKEKLLSRVRKDVLIKAVVQSIHTYIMGYFRLPTGLYNHIASRINKFYWGSKDGEKKIHWIKWDKLYQSKQNGGLGFRDMEAFNMDLLAKQGWRLIKNSESLAARTLSSRYYNRKDFLSSDVGFSPCFTWRSIWQAKCVLEKGECWRIRNGETVKIWKDPWLPKQNGSKPWSTSTTLNPNARVAELMLEEEKEWNTDLINQIFLPFEAQQILDIPIPSSNQVDCFY